MHKSNGITLLALLLTATMATSAQASTTKYSIIAPLKFDFNKSDGGEAETPEEKPNPNGWLAFFQSKGSLTAITDLKQWAVEYEDADAYTLGLNNNDLPAGMLGVAQIGSLNMYDNNIANVKFMKGVNDAITIDFSDMPSLTDISGLKDLKSAKNIYLSNVGITNYSALKGLTNVTFFKAVNNHVTDYTGLQNIGAVRAGTTSTFKVTIDREPSYTDSGIFKNGKPNIYNMPWVSPLCRGIENKKGTLSAKIRGGSSSVTMNLASVCQSNHAWLDAIHQSGSLLGTITVSKLGSFSDNNNIIKLDGAVTALNDSTVPSSPIPFNNEAFLRMSIYDTQFSNIKFMSGATGYDTLDIGYNHNLKDLSGIESASYFYNVSIRGNNSLGTLKGLEGMSTAYSLDLSGNPSLHSISALSNLLSINNLVINGTAITSLAGLDGLIKADTISLGNNKNLTDISALSGITGPLNNLKTYIYLDSIPAKLPASTSFCAALTNDKLTVMYQGNEVAHGDICS